MQFDVYILYLTMHNVLSGKWLLAKWSYARYCVVVWLTCVGVTAIRHFLLLSFFACDVIGSASRCSVSPETEDCINWVRCTPGWAAVQVCRSFRLRYPLCTISIHRELFSVDALFCHISVNRDRFHLSKLGSNFSLVTQWNNFNSMISFKRIKRHAT